jgi:hypothetical protein
MEKAAIIFLMAGAIVFFAFTVIVDFAVFTLSYAGFVIGALMVGSGLFMLYRCEMKRTIVKGLEK